MGVQNSFEVAEIQAWHYHFSCVEEEIHVCQKGVTYVVPKMSALWGSASQRPTIGNATLPLWLRLGLNMQTRTVDRIYKSAWHAMIALVGVYELRTNKTEISKVLSWGLIAFHVDAAINDALDRPTTLQYMLRKLRGEQNGRVTEQDSK